METIDWSYAISTLIIRFVGIFVVLGLLQVVMQITGRLFARWEAKDQKRTEAVAHAKKTVTQEEVAAAALALYLGGKNS